MEGLFEKIRRWLLVAVLILFILQVVTLPFAASFTYAGKGELPEHTLRYTTNNLLWNNTTNIDPETGAAQFRLFDAIVPENSDVNLASEGGSAIIAPGMAGAGTARLENAMHWGSVNYIAVLYRIRSDERIAVDAALTAEGSEPAEKYLLPEGVQEADVLQAVTGKLKHKQMQDFTVSWNWDYENPDQDVLDTLMGISGEESVTVGLYIVVEDKNDYSLPNTRDNSNVGMYTALMTISGLLLILLLLERRRETEECEEQQI